MAEGSKRVELAYLRAWREWRGYSQRELGERAGVNWVTISRLERGASRANWRTIAKLAEGLSITREQLMREEPS